MMNNKPVKVFVAPEFHRLIKASAALEGKTIMAYTREICSIDDVKKRLEEIKREGIKKREFKPSF